MAMTVKVVRTLIRSRLSTEFTESCAAQRAVKSNGVHLNKNRGVV